MKTRTAPAQKQIRSAELVNNYRKAGLKQVLDHRSNIVITVDCTIYWKQGTPQFWHERQGTLLLDLSGSPDCWALRGHHWWWGCWNSFLHQTGWVRSRKHYLLTKSYYTHYIQTPYWAKMFLCLGWSSGDLPTVCWHQTQKGWNCSGSCQQNPESWGHPESWEDQSSDFKWTGDSTGFLP